MSGSLWPSALTSPQAFFLEALSAWMVLDVPPGGNSLTHLHLSCQIFVLVTDDRQGWLLTQSVGTVSERLLQSRRGRRTAYFFIAKAQTPFVWSWGSGQHSQRFSILSLIQAKALPCYETLFFRWLCHEAFRNTVLVHSSLASYPGVSWRQCVFGSRPCQ